MILALILINFIKSEVKFEWASGFDKIVLSRNVYPIIHVSNLIVSCDITGNDIHVLTCKKNQRHEISNLKFIIFLFVQFSCFDLK